jgi:hypothetical protein
MRLARCAVLLDNFVLGVREAKRSQFGFGFSLGFGFGFGFLLLAGRHQYCYL